MARFLPVVVFAFGVVAPAAGGGGQALSAVTPVGKVIGMLQEMMAKGKAEKHDEMVKFATYQQFCESTAAEKKASIAKGESTIDKLLADIAKAEEDIIVTQKAIAGHDADVAAWSNEKAKATAEREKENADFQVEYKDYGMSMEAVERTVSTLRSGSDLSFVEQKAALQHLADLPAITPVARRALGSFLQEEDKEEDKELAELDLAVTAPAAKTFESQSGGVLEIVENMGEKFEEKRDEIEKEEMKKKFAFDSLVQDLTSSIKDASAEREEQASVVQSISTEKAAKEIDASSAKADLAADQKFLADLGTECDGKAKDFELRQTLRAGEIESIQKAIEIMSGAAVAGGTQHLPSLVQKTSLVQLRSSTVTPQQRRAAAFLMERGRASQSRLLALVANRLQEDPFKKVTKMIKDMIEKLMEEANEEAEHKGFCDTEMGSNQQTRDQKSEEVEELTAKAEKLAADIKRLAVEIAELGDSIAQIDAEVSTATEQRAVEKAKNSVTIADAKVALQATQQAVEVLRQFYAKAAEATALSQFRDAVPGSPETFDKPYTGMGGESGILGMLEVIGSDFERLDAETTAAEATAEGSYNKFMTDSSKDKAVKTADMTSKAAQKTSSEGELGAAKKDLKSTQEELDAALAYYEKLKPSCVDAGVSYEERVLARKEEIESLKEALKILG